MRKCFKYVIGIFIYSFVAIFLSGFKDDTIMNQFGVSMIFSALFTSICAFVLAVWFNAEE